MNWKRALLTDSGGFQMVVIFSSLLISGVGNKMLALSLSKR